MSGLESGSLRIRQPRFATKGGSMQSHTWRALGALATAVLCALASAASASAKPNACDVNGTWFGTFASSSGGTTLGSVELEITQHGKKFTWIAHAAGLPMVEVAAGKGKIG